MQNSPTAHDTPLSRFYPFGSHKSPVCLHQIYKAIYLCDGYQHETFKKEKSCGDQIWVKFQKKTEDKDSNRRCEPSS